LQDQTLKGSKPESPSSEHRIIPCKSVTTRFRMYQFVKTVPVNGINLSVYSLSKVT